MASIVEWQSLRIQEYRYSVLVTISRFFGLFGIRRPMPTEAPVTAGDYDYALHVDNPEAPSRLEQYLVHPSRKVAALPMRQPVEKIFYNLNLRAQLHIFVSLSAIQAAPRRKQKLQRMSRW